MAPCKSTAKEDSFESSYHNISLTDSKDRTKKNYYILLYIRMSNFWAEDELGLDVVCHVKSIKRIMCGICDFKSWRGKDSDLHWYRMQLIPHGLVVALTAVARVRFPVWERKFLFFFTNSIDRNVLVARQEYNPLTSESAKNQNSRKILFFVLSP